jgi:hypothetical protein
LSRREVACFGIRRLSKMDTVNDMSISEPAWLRSL